MKLNVKLNIKTGVLEIHVTKCLLSYKSGICLVKVDVSRQNMFLVTSIQCDTWRQFDILCLRTLTLKIFSLQMNIY